MAIYTNLLYGNICKLYFSTDQVTISIIYHDLVINWLVSTEETVRWEWKLWIKLVSLPLVKFILTNMSQLDLDPLRNLSNSNSLSVSVLVDRISKQQNFIVHCKLSLTRPGTLETTRHCWCHRKQKKDLDCVSGLMWPRAPVLQTEPGWSRISLDVVLVPQLWSGSLGSGSVSWWLWAALTRSWLLHYWCKYEVQTLVGSVKTLWRHNFLIMCYYLG